MMRYDVDGSSMAAEQIVGRNTTSRSLVPKPLNQNFETSGFTTMYIIIIYACRYYGRNVLNNKKKKNSFLDEHCIMYIVPIGTIIKDRT